MNRQELNKNMIIDWQLERLQSNEQIAMPREMLEYIEQHPELAAELETLKAFWQPQEPLPKPSAKLKTGFYQSLAQIEQSQNNTIAVTGLTEKSVANDPYYKAGWFQAAAVVLVFVLGLFTGRETSLQPSVDSSQQAIAALQDEVSSLSTVMAISMLQKESASERLAAVSYTRRANMADPALLQSLLSSFEQEKSTAVKLAIVDALKDTDFSSANSEMANIEQSLLEFALNEPQPLVQMALTQMLLEQASPATKNQLIRQLQSSPLDDDVSEFLQLIDAQNRI